MRTEPVCGNFAVLDRLRGVAALLVLLDHAGCVLLGRDLVPRNLLAVQFFFMLSGFVVACGYDARMRAGMGFGNFILRRVIRLYPLILLGAGFGGATLLATDPAFATEPTSLLALLLAILCVPAPDMGFGFGRFPVNPPEWSLFFEIAANLAFATVLPRIGRTTLIGVAIGTSLLYAALTIAFWPGSMPFWCEGVGAAGTFSTGIVLWRLHVRGVVFRWAPSWLALSLTLVAICASPLSLGPSLTPLASLVLFPAIILAGAAHGRCQSGPTGLGALSYPLYILHWPVLLLARAWLMPVIGPTLSVLAACVVACLVAWAALHLFDLPVRARLGRFLLAPRKPKSIGRPSRAGIAAQGV